MGEFTYIKTATSCKRGLLVEEAAEYSGLSVPNFLEGVAKGWLPPGVMLFGKTVFDKRLLDECLDRRFAMSRVQFNKASLCDGAA